jgi:hypothetical protein
MTDNVISLRSGKPLEETKVKEELSAAAEREETIKAHVDFLERILAMTKQGHLEGLIILGRNPETGMMLTDMIFPGAGITLAHAPTYLGYLEMLKLEMADVATMTPVLMSDGSIVDPVIDVLSDEVE